MALHSIHRTHLEQDSIFLKMHQAEKNKQNVDSADYLYNNVNNYVVQNEYVKLPLREIRQRR